MGGGNSDYSIIRTPSKTEFDNFVVNRQILLFALFLSDLFGVVFES